MATRNRSGNWKPTGSRPKIAHVIDSLSISGGAERQLVANLRAFDHDLIEHHVVLLHEAAETRRSDLPPAVHVWNLGENGAAMTRARAAKRLVDLVRRERFDLVHASLPDSGLAARVVGMLTPTRVVESLVNISHEPIRAVDNPNVTEGKLRLHTWLDRLTMRGVDRFHAVSQAVADSWQRVVGIDPARIEVIPRGIDQTWLRSDVTENSRSDVRSEFGFPEEAFLVIAVGRLEPQKGHRYLLEAVAELSEAIPQLRVLIVGRQGIASPAIERQLKTSDLENTVVLAGARRDVSRLLAASDVFAFPSLFEGNGGNAMIEAMAMGLPVITTSSPPMTDLIPDNDHGRLIPRRDSTALLQALVELHADADLRARLGKTAKERAMGFASPADISQRFEGWYRQILGEDGDK
jgi:glycosyltransferase involved in cell wall biosynthesis